MEDTKLEIFLNWPGSTKVVPRPIDILLIFCDESTEVSVLRETYEQFKNIVFKAVVGTNSTAGLAFATEINAKWTNSYNDQDAFLESLVSLNGELNDLMKKTFDSIDTDGSGSIDMNELTNLSKTLGHNLSSEELKVVFAELDENKDQKISYSEFSKWWKKGRRGQGNKMRKLIGF